MFLTIDKGNTRIKFAAFEGGEVVEAGHCQLLEEIQPLIDESERVGICDVSGGLPEWKHERKFLGISAAIRLPFENLYKSPETLGADRIANMAAAALLYPGQNNLVIDAGTCLKFDLLDAGGKYRGGSISAGLQMRYDALEKFTGALPRIEDRDFDELAGLSTEESILAGCRIGLLSEVHYRMHSYEKELGNMNVILCGGDASFLANRLKTGIFAQPLLVHYGIYHCLKIND